MRLLHAAQSYARAGLSVFPVSGKRPNTRLLPLTLDSDSGEKRPSWSPFQLRIPSDKELLSFFSANDTTGMAVACGPVSHGRHKDGGLYIIDVDRIDWVDPFLDRCGPAAKKTVIQRTGRGGVQLAMICRGAAELRNQKIALYPNPDWVEGAQVPRNLCGIESRGFGGYACIAPSIHPNGKPYEVIQGTFEDVPYLDDSDVLAILEAAQSMSEVSVQESRTGNGDRKQHRLNVPRLIMDTFMAEYGQIDNYLVRHGYTRAGRNRMLRPGAVAGANMPGVLLSSDGDAAYFWSSNDPLNQCLNAIGQPFHDIVGAAVHLEYNSDFYLFLEEEGKRYNIEYNRPGALELLIERHAPATKPAMAEAISLYGTKTSPVVFLVTDVAAAEHLANQGVAALVVTRSAKMIDVAAMCGNWTSRYVLSLRNGWSENIAEAMNAKLIDTRGKDVTTLSGVDLFHLMQTAVNVGWDVGAAALRRR